MILVDTSIWIDHFRRRRPDLAELLERGEVAGHPFVIGELACGRLGRRKEILDLLGRLPQAAVAAHGEVLELVERRALMGRGIGWVDVHLLASALLAGASLWTADRPLLAVAKDAGIAFVR